MNKKVPVILIISVVIILVFSASISGMNNIKNSAQPVTKTNYASTAVVGQEIQSNASASNAGLKYPLDSINNKDSTSSGSSFTDNFETDSSLNTNFWSPNSTSLVNLTEQMSYPAATFIQPTLSFNSSGMEMSGPDSTYTGTGIQTVNTYQSPFHLEVAAEGISGPGVAFGIAITNPQLTSYFIVSFEPNPSNGGYYGIWVNDPAIGAIFNLGEQIYGSVSFNTVYTIYLNISSNNTVTLTVGGVVSENFSGIGSGPFYITLFQRIGLPYAPLSEEVALFKYFSLVVGAPPTVTSNLYSVTFTESGLPSGTAWSVTLNGTTETSTTNIISFSEPDGKYSFSIGNVSGYITYPSSGTINVNGVDVYQGITFTVIVTVTVTETTTAFLSSTYPGGPAATNIPTDYIPYLMLSVAIVVASVIIGMAIRRKTAPEGHPSRV